MDDSFAAECCRLAVGIFAELGRGVFGRPEALESFCPPDEGGAAVTRPTGDVRKAPFDEEYWFDAVGCPMFHPVRPLLQRGPVQIDVDAVEIT